MVVCCVVYLFRTLDRMLLGFVKLNDIQKVVLERS